MPQTPPTRLMQVPGARLDYRLVGDQHSDLPVLVFENGWVASHHMWAWIARELTPHARLLFYSRAGIGASTLDRPQTAEGISAQLAALLDALELHEPVVVVGHSYGGLICAVHAAQIPDRIRALVQIDPTAEVDDPQISRGLRIADWAARIVAVTARLGLPDPVFSASTRGLPDEDAAALRATAMRSPSSLAAARAELALMPRLRDVAVRAAGVPRLVISAGRPPEPTSAVMRRLVPADRARGAVEHLQAHHRTLTRRGEGSRWEQLPYDHGGVVFSADGARDTAALTIGFVEDLAAS